MFQPPVNHSIFDCTQLYGHGSDLIDILELYQLMSRFISRVHSKNVQSNQIKSYLRWKTISMLAQIAIIHDLSHYLSQPFDITVDVYQLMKVCFQMKETNFDTWSKWWLLPSYQVWYCSTRISCSELTSFAGKCQLSIEIIVMVNLGLQTPQSSFYKLVKKWYRIELITNWIYTNWLCSIIIYWYFYCIIWSELAIGREQCQPWIEFATIEMRSYNWFWTASIVTAILEAN